MNATLHKGVIGAIHWMNDHMMEHPELLTILTDLRSGEKKERKDPRFTESGITTKTADKAVVFFYEHAGYGFDPKNETPEQGRMRGAIALADAERWLASQQAVHTGWVVDETYNPKDYPRKGMPKIGWGCFLYVDGKRASLWGVTFDGDHTPRNKPYARVVLAELALELMSK